MLAMETFTTFIWLPLLGFFTFLAKKNGATILECTAKRNQDLNDKITNSWLIKEIKLRNSTAKMACAKECMSEPSCFTYMVNRDLRLCRLHRVRISSYNRLIHSPGFTSYDTCRVNDTIEVSCGNETRSNAWRSNNGKESNDTIGVPCGNDTDCTLNNTVCLEQTCQCNYNWSYSSLNQSCVTDCDVYGSEFTSFRYSFISGYNNVILKDPQYINGEACTAACLNATEFVCLSFDLDFLRGSCLLSNMTAFLVPDAFYRDVNQDVDYRHRQCQ